MGKKTIYDKVQEVINWLDNNQEENKETYEAKQKELEAVCNPILQKMYASGGGGMPVECLVVCPVAWVVLLTWVVQVNLLLDLKSKKSIKPVNAHLHPRLFNSAPSGWSSVIRASLLRV